MIRIFTFIAMLCFSINAMAFKCFITLVKANCWQDYNVTLSVLDPENNNSQLVQVVGPKGKAWARGSFDCQPKQALKMQAQFSPIFWAQDKGKVYEALKNWYLPESIKPNETAWNINICFPTQFAEVPFPPEASGACECDLSKVPDVPPQ